MDTPAKLNILGLIVASAGLLTYLYGSSACGQLPLPAYCYDTGRIAVRVDAFGIQSIVAAIALLVVGFSIFFGSAFLKRRRVRVQPHATRRISSR